jgi:hypothetical protein
MKYIGYAVLLVVALLFIRACNDHEQQNRSLCESKGGTLIETRDGSWCVAGVIKMK